MPIPSFLSPSSLNLSAQAPSALATGGSPAPQKHRLAFSIEKQEQANWCWSAVSVSVERFYDSNSTRTQCSLANEALQRQDCCADGGPAQDKCNKPWYLDRVLTITRNYDHMDASSLSFSDIVQQLNAGSAIGCRIGWFGGGGHFAVIIGSLVAASGTRYVDIADPIWPESQVAFDDFPSSYQTGGDWTHTYFTRPATAGGAAVAFSTIDDPNTLGA